MSKRTKITTIRIIGGQMRGRRLTVPDAQGLRPTIDRVRETLFNWLMHDLAGARCLDLFAGTGALGLESLSRGASYVHFIESNALAVEHLKTNLKTLLEGELLKEKSQVTYTNALSLIAKPPAQRYNIVFLDPPFQSNLLEQSLELLEINNWLAEEAMIYIEHDSNQRAPQIPVSWTLYRQGKAGQSAYYLYIS